MFDYSINQIVTFVVCLFISVSLHETMHAFIAFKLGDDLAHSRGRISLNPLKHIDPLLTLGLPTFMILAGLPPILAAKPVPINVNRISGDELGLAAVGLAGPITNFLLASVAAVVLNVLSGASGIITDTLLLFIQINIGLFVFNMLPIPPLDGSRLLYALAPRGLQQFMESIERMGMFINILFIYLALQWLGPMISNINISLLNFLIQ